MSSSSEKADLIAAPFAAADGTGRLGVFRISVTAAGSVAIPTRFQTGTPASNPRMGTGLYVRLKARGTDIQVAFAVTGATLVADQVSVWGTGHAQAGFTISNGESIDVLIPAGASFLCYVPATGTGTLEGFISECPSA